MIQMRWLVPAELHNPNHSRKLQYRYRLGGIGVPANVAGYGLQMGANEGWSDWQDVPVVVAEPMPAPRAGPEPRPRSEPETAESETKEIENDK